MADCPYTQMEWYCSLQEGHLGPHVSHPIPAYKAGLVEYHDPTVRKMTDEEYMDSYAVWREHQDMHKR